MSAHEHCKEFEKIAISMLETHFNAMVQERVDRQVQAELRPWKMLAKFAGVTSLAFVIGSAVYVFGVLPGVVLNQLKTDSGYLQKQVELRVEAERVADVLASAKAALPGLLDLNNNQIKDRLALINEFLLSNAEGLENLRLTRMPIAMATSGHSSTGQNVIMVPDGTVDDWAFIAVAEDYGISKPDNIELRRTGIVWTPLPDKKGWKVTAQSESGTYGANPSSFRCLMVRKAIFETKVPLPKEGGAPRAPATPPGSTSAGRQSLFFAMG